MHSKILFISQVADRIRKCGITCTYKGFLEDCKNMFHFTTIEAAEIMTPQLAKQSTDERTDRQAHMEVLIAFIIIATMINIIYLPRYLCI